MNTLNQIIKEIPNKTKNTKQKELNVKIVKGNLTKKIHMKSIKMQSTTILILNNQKLPFRRN